ncbi:hypothetical protein HY311_00985 [Candidatus Nomurabacteria bacterium]|nr:hypothetical protein [Candidatus Nomurabacteria bacterium]
MKEKNKKLISALLLILIILPAVLFSGPKQAQAQWVVIDPTLISVVGLSVGVPQTIETGNVVVNALIAIAKQVVMVIEKRLLQELTKGITGWINSGFHGSPLFLTNSDSFFHDIAKSEIKTIVGEFGYDPNRFPYGQNFALNVINRYKAAADSNAAYSLSAVMSPIMAQNYRNNFNAGGWNGFLVNTQYPQNNYLGFDMLATDKLARQLQGTTQNAAQKINTTLNQGMGFLSPQICPNDVNPNYNNGYNEFNRPAFQSNLDSNLTARIDACYGPVGSKSAPGVVSDCIAQVNANYQRDLATEKSDWSKKNECKKADGSNGLVNTTPGAVAANQVFKALGSNIDQTALGSMVEGSLSAILNTLVSHFLDQGLNALGNAINGSSSSTDSWSYQGNTLVTNTTGGSAGTNTTITGGPLSVSPTSVSVFPGNAVNNITISGGTPPYILLGNCDNGGAGTTQNITQAACSATTSGAGTWNPTDPQFATVYAQGSTITVIGVAAGNALVTIQDSSLPAKVIILPITITPTATTVAPPVTGVTDLIGTCTISGSPVNNTKQSECTTLGGNWSPTVTTTTGPLGACIVNGTPLQNTTQANCANTPVGAGTWAPYGTCTYPDGTTTTNITEASCGPNIRNNITWVQN